MGLRVGNDDVIIANLFQETLGSGI